MAQTTTGKIGLEASAPSTPQATEEAEKLFDEAEDITDYKAADKRKKLKLYMKSCELNYARACNEASELQDSVEGNGALAQQLKLKACNLNHKESCTSIGFTLIQMGKSEGLSFISKGCKLGDNIACMTLTNIRLKLSENCNRGDKQSCQAMQSL